MTGTPKELPSSKEPWRYSVTGLRVAVRVTPRGGRDAIDGVETLANGLCVLKVRVRAIAEGGEANTAVIRLLAETAGVAKTAARVAAGVTSRIKQVDITGDPRRLAESLRAVLAKAGSL